MTHRALLGRRVHVDVPSAAREATRACWATARATAPATATRPGEDAPADDGVVLGDLAGQPFCVVPVDSPDVGDRPVPVG